MKDTVGLFLVIFGLLGAASFIAYQVTYRFSHSELTETQLVLWTLARWKCWAGFIAVALVGQVMFFFGKSNR